MKKIILIAAFSFLPFSSLALASGCDLRAASKFSRAPAPILLKAARSAYDQNDACEASRIYQEIISQYPETMEAKVSELESLWTLSQAGLYQDSNSAAEYFLILHPNHPKTKLIKKLIRQNNQKIKNENKLRWQDDSGPRFSITGYPKDSEEIESLKSRYERFGPKKTDYTIMLRVEIPF